MFFKTAGIEVLPWVPPLVAFIISFFTSMGGISGAFLLLPFQMSFLNYTNPSASATNQLYNVIAIPSGVYGYWRERRLAWPLSLIIIIGTLPGVFLGAFIRVKYLPDPIRFKFFAAVVIIYLAVTMIKDLLVKSFYRVSHNSGKVQSKRKNPARRIIHLNLKRLVFTFNDTTYELPSLGIIAVSFFVGIAGGIYGIGGGAIIAPFFISFFRLPVHVVAGAALLGNFVTSVAGVASFHIMANYFPGLSIAPDWLLGILFGSGGMVGMYLGARCQKFVPAIYIKWMLAIIMAYTAIKYIIDYLNAL